MEWAAYDKFVAVYDNPSRTRTTELDGELHEQKYLYAASLKAFNDFDLYNIRIGMSMVIMDSYCLSRLFRTFTFDPRGSGPPKYGSGCTADPNLCVVYTGDAHSDVYYNFITTYFHDAIIKKRTKADDTKRLHITPYS